MNRFNSIVVVALFGALLLPLTALAGEDAPPGSPKTPSDAEKPGEAEKPAEEKPRAPEMDEISKKLIEGYEESIYHLGRAGVKKARCVLSANWVETMGGQEMKGKATYEWDGKKSTMEWDNAQLGMMLAQVGVARETIDKSLDDSSLADEFMGAKLTGRMNEDGTSTISIEGETKQGFTAFHFDEAGILSGVDLEKDIGMGQPTEIKTSMRHEKVGEKLVVAGLVAKLEVPKMGELTATTRFTYSKLGEFTVLAKSRSDHVLAGSKIRSISTTFTDWKLNDDVK